MLTEWMVCARGIGILNSSPANLWLRSAINPDTMKATAHIDPTTTELLPQMGSSQCKLMTLVVKNLMRKKSPRC